MQGSDITTIRRSLGWTKGRLADELGMSGKFVGMMERGEAPIETRTALAIRQLHNQHSRLFTSHRVTALPGDIPLARAQVIWDDEGELDPPIRVVDVTGRVGRDDSRYISSWGACNGDFVERDDVGKLLSLLAMFAEWTAVDGLDAAVVHRALSVIPEYRRALDFGAFNAGVSADPEDE